LHATQASLDIAEALAVSELSEGQREKLVEAGEALHFVIASIALYATMELDERKKVHDWSEDGSSHVHDIPFSSEQVEVNSNRFGADQG
jgi:hypothetical protein